MKINIENLLNKFKNINDYEYEGAIHKTNVKAVGPCAYLNIVFRAVPENLRKDMIVLLNMPDDLIQFYSQYNGARLLLGAIDILGFLPENRLIDRADYRKSYPYDILELNDEYSKKLPPKNLICFGIYGEDNSLICMERQTKKIICFEKNNLNKVRACWHNFEEWLTKEIMRISAFFQEDGTPLLDMDPPIVHMQKTLPQDNND